MEPNDYSKYLERFFLLEYVLQNNYGWEADDNYNIDKDCCICYESVKDTPVMKIPCGHVFHYDCVYTSILKFNRYNCCECNKKYTERYTMIDKNKHKFRELDLC